MRPVANIPDSSIFFIIVDSSLVDFAPVSPISVLTIVLGGRPWSILPQDEVLLWQEAQTVGDR